MTRQEETEQRIEQMHDKLNDMDKKLDLLTTLQTDIRWIKRLLFAAWTAILTLFGIKL